MNYGTLFQKAVAWDGSFPSYPGRCFGISTWFGFDKKFAEKGSKFELIIRGDKSTLPTTQGEFKEIVSQKIEWGFYPGLEKLHSI
jgi:hypothetical protein